MIERTRIEQLVAWEAEEPERVLVFPIWRGEYKQLLPQHLALLAIVEDVLHAPPLYFDHDDEHVLCTMCHTSVEGDGFLHDAHKPMCPYGRAVELLVAHNDANVGDKSNPIEFDGISAETE